MPPPELRPAIERFLAHARRPAAIEPGEDPILLTPGHFAFTGAARLECWNDRRNLARRIRSVHAERRGKLELVTEHFGGRTGRMLLVDLAHPSNTSVSLQGNRLKYREQFRLSLARQYPDWRIAEISTAPDLEHSLSPAYPRALLRKGSTAMAAIGASDDCLDPDGALTFGLIWLDHLRRREPRLSIGGLLVFLPIGSEVNTCHRARHLTTQIAIFVHSPGSEEPVHPEDYTNFTTQVEAPRNTVLSAATPEALLEARVRANVQLLDGTLLPEPVYTQAPELTSAYRGILDLLAIDFEGRLAIIELKASEDLHLPLQALDYWMRVKWHLERGDFARAGYFPGHAVRPGPPRLLLVAPALQFHPTNETILRAFSSDVQVERLGLGLEWRRELKVVLRQTCR